MSWLYHFSKSTILKFTKKSYSNCNAFSHLPLFLIFFFFFWLFLILTVLTFTWALWSRKQWQLENSSNLWFLKSPLFFGIPGSGTPFSIWSAIHSFSCLPEDSWGPSLFTCNKAKHESFLLNLLTKSDTDLPTSYSVSWMTEIRIVCPFETSWRQR